MMNNKLSTKRKLKIYLLSFNLQTASSVFRLFCIVRPGMWRKRSDEVPKPRHMSRKTWENNSFRSTEKVTNYNGKKCVGKSTKLAKPKSTRWNTQNSWFFHKEKSVENFEPNLQNKKKKTAKCSDIQCKKIVLLSEMEISRWEIRRRKVVKFSERRHLLNTIYIYSQRRGGSSTG